MNGPILAYGKMPRARIDKNVFLAYNKIRTIYILIARMVRARDKVHDDLSKGDVKTYEQNTNHRG